MRMNFADSELEMELFDGEYWRFRGEDELNHYFCVGVLDTNKIFFQYIDTTQESVDFVQSVISNVPELAMQYLIDVLSENNDLLVRLIFQAGSPTGFEIYYDCDYQSTDIGGLIDWMGTHNDFAATEYRYTEIINGHQQCAAS